MFLLSLLHDILINIYISCLLLNRKQLAVNVLKSTPVKLVTKPLVMNVSLVSDGDLIVWYLVPFSATV
jgi:hypothetical protein